jgi:hypothetical protein
MKTTLHSKKRACTLKKKPALLQVCLVLFSFVIIHKAQSQNCTINSGLSQQVCTSTATLNGNINGIAIGNPAWTFISGPATPVIVTPNSLTSNVTGMTVPGDYVFQIAQVCQAGGTAIQQVTVTANPQPAFTVNGGFAECGNYNSVHTLTASLPAGWTGTWKASDAAYGTNQTGNFIFSNINSPVTTVQLIPGAQNCGNSNFNFSWEVTSPNGLCKYSKSVNGIYNPDISLLDYDVSDRTICGPGNVQYGPKAGFCGFWQLFHPGYTFTVVAPITTPAGFTGTLGAGTNANNSLLVTGFSTIGIYTFSVKLTSPCGDKIFGPFKVTVLPPRPAPIARDGNKAFCIKSIPGSVSFMYSLADPTVISTVSVCGGFPALTVTETGTGTVNRTIVVTPTSPWKPGTYCVASNLRSVTDPGNVCPGGFFFLIYVFDSLQTSLAVAPVNKCIPTGSTSVSVSIPPPPYPTAYLGFVDPYWTITRLSGPNSGPAVFQVQTVAFSIPGLTAGQYKYKIQPLAGSIYAQEVACAGGPYEDSFIVNVYNQAAANAGSNQNVLCVNNFALAANIPASPSFGTWSQVSGPTPLTFTDIHDPNARAGNPGTTLPGDYVFRWTITDPNGACSIVFSDVTINSLTVCTPLPVSLFSFSAQKLQDKTFIQWTTVTEQYSKAFVVEWSSNGQSWQAIGTVAAAGNSNTPVNYSFVHDTPAKGINYYRLKQVDLDSRHTYSRVAAVRFDNSVIVSIFPNPVRDNLYLNNTKPGDLIKIIAGDGKVMLNRKVLGENETVDMSHYANGFYILHIINGETGANSAFKVTKQ